MRTTHLVNCLTRDATLVEEERSIPCRHMHPTTHPVIADRNADQDDARPRPSLEHPLPPPRTLRPAGACLRWVLAALRSVLTAECLCATALILWIFILIPCNSPDPDIDWHLANAAKQFQSHTLIHPALLSSDTYSFTAHGAPWIDHEWLAELPFYYAWKIAGPAGLYTLTLITIESIFLGLFRLILMSLPLGQASSLSLAFFLTVTGSVLATVSFGPRTLLFGWALLLVQLYLLNSFARQPRSIFALPLLFAFWINTHGSWLIGITLFVVFVLSGLFSIQWGAIRCVAWSPRQRRCLFVVLLLSLAALFLNPYGWRLVAYPFDLAFHQPLNIANVEEWRPLNIHSLRGGVLLAVLAALFGSQLAPSRTQHPERRHWTPCELLFLAIGGYAAFIHERFLFLAAILVMPQLARQLAQLGGDRQSHTRRIHPLIARTLNVVLLLAMLVLTLRTGRKMAQQTKPQPLPKATAAFLSAFLPQGRVFNAYAWGGYLIHADPQIPVFIDSRVDIYERTGVLRDYLAIIRLQHSLELLDTYHIHYVLFEPDTPLVYLLQNTHTWKTVYQDPTIILLERLP